MLRRWLAAQYAQPSGWLGRLLLAGHLNRLSGDMIGAALEALAPEPGERLLEVGFGGGDLVARLLEISGADITGVDISEAMVARARRRFRREIEMGRARMLPGAADRLPIGDGVIDRAASVNVLYFWDEPAEVMAEFARVIRPGGRLVLCFQTPDQVRAWPGHVHGFRAYGEADVRGWLERGGFGAVAAQAGRDRKLGDFICLSATRLGAKAAS